MDPGDLVADGRKGKTGRLAHPAEAPRISAQRSRSSVIGSSSGGSRRRPGLRRSSPAESSSGPRIRGRFDAGCRHRAAARPAAQTTPAAAALADLVRTVAELGEDLVGVLAEERRRRPDRGRRRATARNGGATWRIGPRPGWSTSTVMPARGRLGEANAVDDVVDRPGRDVGGVERDQPLGRRSARRTARPGSGIRPSRLATRSPFVAKRGSSASAGSPSARQNRGHWRSLPTATAIAPSAVANVSYGTMFGWALPSRPGAPPPTNAFWAWLTRPARVDAEQRDVDPLAGRPPLPPARRRRAPGRAAPRGPRPRRSAR